MLSQTDYKFSDQRITFNTYPLIEKFRSVEKIDLLEINDFPKELFTVCYFGNEFALKIFRTLDPGIHPSPEIAGYLYYQSGFPATPAPLGSIKLNAGTETFTLGVFEQTISNSNSADEYISERVNNYIERLLAFENPEKYLLDLPLQFSFVSPFDSLNSQLQTLLGSRAASSFNVMGELLSECHLSFARGKTDSFLPEEFTLHYQQSLYSSIRGLVKRLLNTIERNKESPKYKEYVYLLSLNDEIANYLKSITSKKLEAQKIRVHGNLDLRHFKFAGNKAYITDFGSNPQKHLSRRRLKRSPLLDIASFIVSVYRITHKTFSESSLLKGQQLNRIKDFASLWSVYMSGFFLDSYIEATDGYSLIPTDRKEVETMLGIYILENLFSQLNNSFENNKPIETGLTDLIKLVLSDN